MDAQIDISEYKNTEKDYNAYDTVIISENHTVCSNKRNTECYIYKNFKDINKKMLRHGDIIIEKSGGSDKQPVGRVFLLAFYNF